MIRDALLKETGTRWLNPDVTSDQEMMRNLIDNAALEANLLAGKGLEIAMGIRLSSQQIAALTHDIVWYVVEQVAGQDVLVPYLYLAPTTQIALSQRAATITAGNLLLDTDAFTNQGRIAVHQNMQLASRGDIVNISGVIDVGGNASLRSSQGDVISRTQTTGTGGSHADGYSTVIGGSSIGTIIGETGRIHTGGDLTLDAARHVMVRGGDIQTKGDLKMRGGEKITIGTIQAHSTLDTDASPTSSTYYASTKHHGSNVMADGDISLESGGTIAIDGSVVAAGQDMDIAGADVKITAAADHAKSRVVIEKSGFGRSSYSRHARESVNHQSSMVGAGGDLRITADDDLSGNIEVVGSSLYAGDNVTLTAANDVTLDVATNSYDQDSYQKKSGWFASMSADSGGIGVSVGKRKREQGMTLQQREAVTSQINAGQSITVQAGDTITAHAANLYAKDGNIRLEAGNDIDWKTADELYEHSQFQKIKQAGLSLSLREHVSDAVAAFEQGKDVLSGKANGIMDSAAGLFKAASAAQQLATGNLVSANASLGVSSHESRSKTRQQTARVGTIHAGQDVIMEAGRDITLEGTHINAGNDIALNAGRDIMIHAAKNHSQNAASSKDSSASVGGSIGVGLAGVSSNMSIAAAQGNMRYDNASTTYQNAQLQAGNDITLTSHNDMTIKGAQIEAGHDATLNVGGDLHVASLQNSWQHRGNNSKMSASLSLSENHGWGNDDKHVSKGISAGLQRGNEAGSRKFVDEQTHITAVNNLNVHVGDHTQLDGAILAAKEGDIVLSTGSFDHKNLDDHYDYQQQQTTINASYSFAGDNTLNDPQAADRSFAHLEAQQKSNQTTLEKGVAILEKLPSISHQKTTQKVKAITRATVTSQQGDVTIDVRDDPDADVSSLNRDLAKAQEVTYEARDESNIHIDGKAIAHIADVGKSLKHIISNYLPAGTNTQETIALVQAALGEDDQAIIALMEEFNGAELSPQEEAAILAALKRDISILDALDQLDKKTKDAIITEVGVFIDGTNNNMYRDEPLGKESNVARLFRSYNGEKEYLRGVGSGVMLDKVCLVTGCGEGRQMDGALKALRKKYEPGKLLIIDMSGFSRGAATTRHFANQILEKGVPGVPPHAIFIRSAVVFDTVASTNLPGNNIDVNRDYSTSPHVGMILHPVAENEERIMFDLQSMLYPDGSSPDNVREKSFPGAHSDVGGSYAPGAQGTGRDMSFVPLGWAHNIAVENGVPYFKLKDDYIPSDAFQATYGDYQQVRQDYERDPR